MGMLSWSEINLTAALRRSRIMYMHRLAWRRAVRGAERWQVVSAKGTVQLTHGSHTEIDCDGVLGYF